MVMQLGPGTRFLGDHAEIQVLALDHRTVRGREMRVEAVRLHSFETEERHRFLQGTSHKEKGKRNDMTGTTPLALCLLPFAMFFPCHNESVS